MDSTTPFYCRNQVEREDGVTLTTAMGGNCPTSLYTPIQYFTYATMPWTEKPQKERHYHESGLSDHIGIISIYTSSYFFGMETPHSVERTNIWLFRVCFFDRRTKINNLIQNEIGKRLNPLTVCHMTECLHTNPSQFPPIVDSLYKDHLRPGRSDNVTVHLAYAARS